MKRLLGAFLGCMLALPAVAQTIDITPGSVIGTLIAQPNTWTGAQTFSGTVTGPDAGTWTSTALTATEFIPTSSTAPTNGLYLSGANIPAIATNGNGNLFISSTTVSVGASGGINAGDTLALWANTDATSQITVRNINAGTIAKVGIYFNNNTSSTEASIFLNGGGFSGGLGANALAITSAGNFFIVGGSTTAVKVDASGNFFVPSIASLATTSAVCVTTATGALSYDATVGTCTVSDETLKNIGPRIDRALDKLLQIDGIYFTFKDQEQYGRGQQIGVGAQTVERVFPELVSTDGHGIKSADYQKLTAPIIEALRELKNRLVAVEARGR